MQPLQGLYYELGGGAKKGPALLLIHPLGGNLRIWDSVRQIWGDRHRVLAYDLPGAGRSPLPPAPQSMRTRVAELSALLASVDIQRVVPVGVAIGAMIAASYAAAHPDSAIGLVLCNPAVQLSARGRELARARLERLRAAGVDGLLPGVVDLAFNGMPRDERYDSYLAQFRRNDPRGYELNVLATLDLDIADDLNRIACPTLVLAGEKDVLFPPAEVRHVAEKIPGAVLREIQDSAHFPPVQNPAAFAAEVDSFVGQLTNSEPPA